MAVLTATERTGRIKPRRRVLLIVALGLVLCGGAVALRLSPWAKDKYLHSLSSHSLYLLSLEHPRDALVFEELGKRLSEDGDGSGSLQAFQRAVELDPNRADAQLGLGVGLMRAGQPYAAERALVKAATLRPKDPAPHFNLAELYSRYRNVTSSVAPLEKATELDPHDAEAWYRLGMAYADLHQWDQSLAALQRAVAVNPRRPVYWRDLAQIQMHFGKSADARDSLGRARDLDPTDPSIPVLLAKAELALGGDSANLAKLEALLKEALQRDAHYAAAHRELGTLRLRRGKVPDAIRELRLAVKYDSSDGQALFQLGQALLRAGQREEGEKMIRGFRELTEALRTVGSLEDRIHQDPKNADLRLRMAREYRRYDWDERAVNQYQVYLSLKPDDVKVQKELQSYVARLRSGDKRAPARSGKQE
jgi:Flp pilus assembly protein TadD